MNKDLNKTTLLRVLVAASIAVVVLIVLLYSDSNHDEREITDLDYNEMWNYTSHIGNIVHTAYEGDEIRKGRAFGTKGDNATADYLLHELREMGFDEKNSCKEKIEPLWYKPFWHYSKKVETVDYRFRINLPAGQNILIPKNETFVFPSAMPELPEITLNHNYTFNGVRVVPLRDLPHLFKLDIFYNILCEPVNTNYSLMGKAEFISDQDNIPDEQTGIIFVLEEKEGSELLLTNLSEATGGILIHDNYTIETSNIELPIVRISSEDENLSRVLNLIENNINVMVSNAADNETLTFWVVEDETVRPNYPYMVLVGIQETDDPWYVVGTRIYSRSAIEYWSPNCRGYILYDKHNDTHFMGFTTRDWKGYPSILRSLNFTDPALKDYFPRIFSRITPCKPVFSVNRSIGMLLEKHAYNESCNITGSYLNQRYVEVEAYNVVAKIEAKNNPSGETVVISNRYDGWWGETPGDSGAGTALVLGIAKYFKDNGISPEKDIVFLFTTGEEYGMRGAWHYKHKHPHIGPVNNIVRWIGADQLGFNQPNTTLGIYSKNPQTIKIVWAISNDTHYEERTKHYKFSPNNSTYIGGGAEDLVWRTRCDTICFVKNYAWDGYHRAGKNFTVGDCLASMDRNDLNITFELFWNITKYFTINPECKLGKVSFKAIDSDNDTLHDSILANFTINTTLHQDITLLNLTLYQHDENNKSILYYQWNNYTVSYPDNISDSLIISIPAGIEEGNFSVEIKLYNSTGRINEILYLEPNNYCDTSISNIYHLYAI